MGTTPSHGLRYPDPGDSLRHTPDHVKNLANDVDNLLDNIATDVVRPAVAAQVPPAVAAAVPPAVAAAIDSHDLQSGADVDKTIDWELALRGVVMTDDARLLQETSIREADFSVRYEDGTPFLEADEKLGITSKIAHRPGSITDVALSAGMGIVQLDADSGYAFGVAFQNPTSGQITMEWGVTDDAVADGASGGGGGTTVKETSGPNFAAPGDSLTVGAGGGGTSYPSVLQSLLPAGRTVRNLGVGGEDSRTIAGRAGGRPYLVTIPTGAIPASGGVVVNLAGDDGGDPFPLVQSNIGVNPVRLAGVTGTLTRSASNVYTFTRAEAGAAVPVNFPTPLSTEAARNNSGDIQLMWWGQNDDTNDATDIIGRQRAQIEFLPVLNPRCLVLGLTTNTGAYRAPMEAQLLREYGRRFVNVRAYLSSRAALDDAGITPTSADLAAIANGSTPPSFRSDAVHLNAAGYTRVAHLVYSRLREMSWT